MGKIQVAKDSRPPGADLPSGLTLAIAFALLAAGYFVWFAAQSPRRVELLRLVQDPFHPHRRVVRPSRNAAGTFGSRPCPGAGGSRAPGRLWARPFAHRPTATGRRVQRTGTRRVCLGCRVEPAFDDRLARGTGGRTVASVAAMADRRGIGGHRSVADLSQNSHAKRHKRRFPQCPSIRNPHSAIRTCLARPPLRPDPAPGRMPAAVGLRRSRVSPASAEGVACSRVASHSCRTMFMATCRSLPRCTPCSAMALWPGGNGLGNNGPGTAGSMGPWPARWSSRLSRSLQRWASRQPASGSQTSEEASSPRSSSSRTLG